ncbi:MAG: hypothetical protein HYR56_09205, partial [Acidobacteria bacterium]|nr:hypothetical protein [Acidobacteriota bacterium]
MATPTAVKAATSRATHPATEVTPSPHGCLPFPFAPNNGRSACPVYDFLFFATNSGVPSATMRPPSAPGEVRKLELTPVIARLSRHAAVAAAGLEFTYAGEPGSLIAAALSLSNDRNQVFRVPMRDAAVQSSSTGEYP